MENLKVTDLHNLEDSILKNPKIVCSPSHVDIRSRANTTRRMDFDHKIKARAHKEGEDR
jgi:hypothetical protein